MTANFVFLTTFGVACFLPMVHVAAISLSSQAAAGGGYVKLLPVDFTTTSYEFVVSNRAFLKAFGVSLRRIALGVSVNMFLIVMVAYPLSREAHVFPARRIYIWGFIVSMLFSGGLIPLYIMVRNLGLLDSIWSLVLPVAVPVYSVILIINFFRNVPKELEEAAYIDGAGHWITMWKIYVPVSRPALATVALFAAVGHWNSWFDGLIYMFAPEGYPLQTYLYTTVIVEDFEIASLDPEQMELITIISDRTVQAAQIFAGLVPIVLVYPFLQRYFIKGIVLGSLKG